MAYEDEVTLESATVWQRAPGPELAAEQGLSLPTIPPEHVLALNAIYRRRRTLAVTFAGRPANIAVSWPPPIGALPNRYRIELIVDDDAGEVVLSRAMLDVLVSAVSPELSLDRLAPDQAAIVIEFALSDALEAIEASLGLRLSIAAVRVECEAPRICKPLTLAFVLRVKGLGASRGEVRLAPAHAVKLARLLDRRAQADRAAVELPFVVCLRVAAATLTVHEIETLSPGDVVLVDRHCEQPNTAVAVIAEHLVAPVELTPAGGKVVARRTRGNGSQWEWSMENVAEKSAAEGQSDTDLDDLPVRLVFELGRVELSLGEIRQLAPGALVPLARPPEDALDIVANGRRIGHGTLVRIGDSLGVRVTRLFGND